MKRVLLGVIGISGLLIAAPLSNANAADMPLKAPPPAAAAPVFSWTGLYFGAQAGGVWGHDSGNITNPGIPFPPPIFVPFTFTTQSAMGGLHAGYNLQISQWVFGVEGSIDWMNLNKASMVGICPLFCGAATTKSDYQASVRGRVGIAFDRALIYGTGGVAMANITNTYDTTAFGGGFASISRQRDGWTAGGGIDYAVTNNWSLLAEYRYSDFGSYADKSSVAFFPATNVNHHLTESQAEVGISYKVGGQ
jgi:outer membrane immunogenic protein